LQWWNFRRIVAIMAEILIPKKGGRFSWNAALTPKTRRWIVGCVLGIVYQSCATV
jgi:hypothetical protein